MFSKGKLLTWYYLLTFSIGVIQTIPKRRRDIGHELTEPRSKNFWAGRRRESWTRPMTLRTTSAKGLPKPMSMTRTRTRTTTTTTTMNKDGVSLSRRLFYFNPIILLLLLILLSLKILKQKKKLAIKRKGKMSRILNKYFPNKTVELKLIQCKTYNLLGSISVKRLKGKNQIITRNGDNTSPHKDSLALVKLLNSSKTYNSPSSKLLGMRIAGFRKTSLYFKGNYARTIKTCLLYTSPSPRDS